MMLRVFNYNTLEKVEMFEAHSDYIRSIIVHPTQPYVLTSSGKWSFVIYITIDMWNQISFFCYCNNS